MSSRTMLKYEALHNSVCFLCLISRGSREALYNAHETKVNKSRDQLEVLHNGRAVRVHRTLNLEHALHNRFLRSVKQCPPSCNGPIQEDLEVGTTDELGIFDMMENQLLRGTGALIDARPTDQHETETIPGSLNIPYTSFHLESDSPELVDALEKLGVKHSVKREDSASLSDRMDSKVDEFNKKTWEFSCAKNLVIWGNGPMGAQSRRAISGLLQLGYPAEKISYYRGGLQLWKIFGLTTIATK